jgi:hypothetical protein
MTFNILNAGNSGRLAIQYIDDAKCQILYLLNSKLCRNICLICLVVIVNCLHAQIRYCEDVICIREDSSKSFGFKSQILSFP